MTDLSQTIDTHLAAYCEPDPQQRRKLLDEAWTPDGVLLDPPIDGHGPAAIAGLVDIVLQHYPDHRFRRTSAVDAHHDHARYAWELVGPDGSVAVNGIDVARVDEAGRLVQVVGFFGDLPSLPA